MAENFGEHMANKLHERIKVSDTFSSPSLSKCESMHLCFHTANRLPSTLIRLSIVLCLVAVPEACTYGSGELSADVVTALEKNVAFLERAEISGEISRRFLQSPEKVLKSLQQLRSEEGFARRLKFKLLLNEGRFRESIEYPPGDVKPSGMLNEKAYDGTSYRSGYKDLITPHKSSVIMQVPSLMEEFARQQGIPSTDYLQSWYLNQTGFILPSKVNEFGQRLQSIVLLASSSEDIASVTTPYEGDRNIVEIVLKVPEPWASEETFDIDTSKHMQEFYGESKDFQMRIERQRRELAGASRKIRVLLDKSLGCAVVEKWDYREGSDATMFHTLNSDFEQVGDDDVWMPMKCIVKSSAIGNAPLYISEVPLYETVIEMTKCKAAEGRLDDFKIWYDAPGTNVTDYKESNSEPRIYRVPASTDELGSKMSSWRQWLFAFNALFFVGLVGWFVLKKLRVRA